MAEENINKAQSEEEADSTPKDDVQEAAEAVNEQQSEPCDEEQQPSAEERLAAEAEELKKELEAQKEKYLRLDAEYYNYRTRSVKEKSEAYENALVSAVTEVLSVIDNFERALNAETTDENYKKGIEMIFKQYLAILEKLGVTEIEAQGKPFDPNLHNAVSSTEDENLGENTVAAVLQKGYAIGKRVIRHAMVTVANP